MMFIWKHVRRSRSLRNLSKSTLFQGASRECNIIWELSKVILRPEKRASDDSPRCPKAHDPPVHLKRVDGQTAVVGASDSADAERQAALLNDVGGLPE